MGRWAPNARERLEAAALDLFAENGYEETTVAQIADRAGLNRATFFRHFADKREVLFGGEDVLSGLFADAIGAASPDATLIECLQAALGATGVLMTPQRRATAARRALVIAANSELQERGLLKYARMANSIAAALRERGADELSARLGAEVGALAFSVAFGRWMGANDDAPFLSFAAAALSDLQSRAAELDPRRPADRLPPDASYSLRWLASGLRHDVARCHLELVGYLADEPGRGCAWKLIDEHAQADLAESVEHRNADVVDTTLRDRVERNEQPACLQGDITADGDLQVAPVSDEDGPAFAPDGGQGVPVLINRILLEGRLGALQPRDLCAGGPRDVKRPERRHVRFALAHERRVVTGKGTAPSERDHEAVDHRHDGPAQAMGIGDLRSFLLRQLDFPVLGLGSLASRHSHGSEGVGLVNRVASHEAGLRHHAEDAVH